MATKQSSAFLTAAERKQFERDGFLSFDPGISADVLDRVIADLDDLYRFEEGPDRVDENGVRFSDGPNPRIADAWKLSEAAQEVALAPRVLGLLEELYGRRPKPFQTLNFMNGTEQAAHVDGMYFNSEPQGWMCGVWVALEDIDMDNGPLVYYPGSHNLPLPTWDELGEIDRSDFASYGEFTSARVIRYQEHVAQQVESYPREAEFGTIERGQALVWAAHLIHGGSTQRDRSRTRHSQVTHYYFEGDEMRHAWPLGKEGARTMFRYPGWITWSAPKGIGPELVRDAIESNVPAGARVAVAAEGDVRMLDVPGREAIEFPLPDDAASEAVAELERLRGEGVEYLAIPGWIASRLATPELSTLQQHVENRYRSVMRDGATCVIFALD